MEKVACGFVHIGRVRFRHMERVQRRAPYQASWRIRLGPFIILFIVATAIVPLIILSIFLCSLLPKRQQSSWAKLSTIFGSVGAGRWHPHIGGFICKGFTES